MAISPTDRAIDPVGEDVPHDLILLLSSNAHIRERVRGGAFLEFVQAVLDVIADHCENPPALVAELQVARALLPGHRLIVEVQTDPEGVRSLHARGLTRRLRALAVPAVEGGPVVFARRVRLLGEDRESPFTMPFGGFRHGNRPVHLDAVLLEAGGVKRAQPVPSFWGRVKGSLWGQGASSSLDHEPGGIPAAISRRTGVAAIAVDRRLVVTGGRHEPSTTFEDRTSGAGPSSVPDPNGTGGVVEQAMLDYVRSDAPQPTQAALDVLLHQVGRVRVLEGGMAQGQPLGSTVLLDLAEAGSLAELRQALAILDGPGGHCAGCGDPTLELLSPRDERLAVLGVHRGRSVRWAGWKDDAELLDGRRLIDWLAGHGVPGPHIGTSS